MKQPSLFDESRSAEPPDSAARAFAVDPAHHIVLEASAGTGKTRVLVDRYVRLASLGVDPRHILAVTFTRKAAAEMRERVLAELGRQAEAGRLAPDRWRTLQTRLPDIQISTIDAFCFGLLREFPLEAGMDPAVEIADETEMARFTDEALDLTFRAIRGVLADDENVRLLLTRVKAPILRETLATLIDRRHLARSGVATFVKRLRGPATAREAAAAFVKRVADLLATSPDCVALLDDGPHGAPEFRWLFEDLSNLEELAEADPARVQVFRHRLERHVLTKAREPRKKLASFGEDAFATPAARKRHGAAVASLAPAFRQVLDQLETDVNGLLARGLHRVLVIACGIYERLLADHALMDFAAMLHAAVALLERQEEFARSRLKLQARYHHVLVDEFQDTSRLQWRLIELLIDAWGEGEGVADAPTSIFIVGDRKQSIYRFRHAEVRLLDEAARKIAALRPDRPVRHAISHSFRAVPELLAFVNALSRDVALVSDFDERFRYDETDHFPVPPAGPGARRDGQPVVGLVAESSMDACARAVAAEVGHLLTTATVRDRDGVREARPDDVAILFRARAGHQFFEDALEARGIRTYVYKGLGFFDAPEVQDLQALVRFLARPDSDLRAAELLRSRLVRLSDEGLVTLAPAIARAVTDPDLRLDDLPLDDLDRALLDRTRASAARWIGLAARLPPSELVDRVLADAAYIQELQGRRLDQARENIKKVRLLVRRVESRGYATLDRIATYFDTLRAGDESNAIVGAVGCVNLMTIHAAKGLEFPIVFVVNLQTPGRGRPPVSVIDRSVDGEPEVAFDRTAGTDLEDQREQEELRRLLYVAVTRARDRLYLAAELDSKGRLGRRNRSLAALLPAGLADAFARAGSGDDEVAWQTGDGSFDFRVARDPADAPIVVPAPAAAPQTAVDVAALVPADRRVAAATLGTSGQAPPTGQVGERDPGRRLVGTLVHRLFQRRIDSDRDPSVVASIAAGMLSDLDLVDEDNPAALVAAATDLYVRLRDHEDLRATLSQGEASYEVPVSWVRRDDPATIVRGVIDCVVRRPDGGVTILELKTGAPRPGHEEQARRYAEAFGTALGSSGVQVKIVYPRVV
ncbi:MAG TPA: UvrD-helicase domain-containing protein [Vicinamibacterales bacterium]|nr:UvrD-helicase domain-containing protein [Vicinamibacterales bacterium]